MKEEQSSKCMHIRSIADLLLKWKDMRNVDITPNWRDMRSIADIPKSSIFFISPGQYIQNKRKSSHPAAFV